MKWLHTKPTNSKIRCKVCLRTQPDMPELRTHMRGNHPAEWSEFSRQMRAFDEAHAEELSSKCSICDHRGKHTHGGKNVV